MIDKLIDKLIDIIAEIATCMLSVIAGSVSSPLKAARVRASATPNARRVAASGRGLTAQRLLFDDFLTGPPKSPTGLANCAPV